MTTRTATILSAALAACSLTALAQPAPMEAGVEVGRVEAYGGFGAIDHVQFGLVLPSAAGVRSTLRLEHRRQEARGGSPSTQGESAEGIFTYDIGSAFYGLTRVGFTNENTLFVDRALYQEFGWKAGRLGPTNVDLNLGVGTRRFTTGTETFWSFGPTVSWADGALWLRREQSGSGGGWRHSVTLRQTVAPGWQVELFALDESRRKFTIPLGPGVTATDFEGRRYALGVWHQLTPAVSLFVRGERITLDRVGTPGHYYAPDAYSAGINVRF